MNPYQAIALEVAPKYGVCPKAVTGPTRGRKNVCAARDEVYWRLNLRGNSLNSIGRWASRDHTSVLNGVRNHQQRYEAAHAARWAR